MAPVRLGAGWIAAGVAAVVAATVLGVGLGPVSLPLGAVFLELIDHLPGVDVDSGLTPTQAAIVWDIRFPRVVLGLVVGSMLAISGASYQAAFRNPLADPYLLGIAAGAGMGATIGFVTGAGDAVGVFDAVPLLAFAGALVAIALTFAVGGSRAGAPVILLLAGVAVASFFTAAQTYLVQRDSEVLRQVYSWILGRLSTSGWSEVLVVVPYAIVTSVILLRYRRALDVLSVGDDEAAALGLSPRRVRTIVVLAASLSAAAAVAVSGLIGFVGLVVPHAIRLLAGASNRIVLPLSLFFGAAFLALADLVARTVDQPAELPIGVVTAFVGAPFFLVVLRTTQVRS